VASHDSQGMRHTQQSSRTVLYSDGERLSRVTVD